jgi:hypothetical protein
MGSQGAWQTLPAATGESKHEQLISVLAWELRDDNERRRSDRAAQLQ